MEQLTKENLRVDEGVVQKLNVFKLKCTINKQNVLISKHCVFHLYSCRGFSYLCHISVFRRTQFTQPTTTRHGVSGRADLEFQILFCVYGRT